MVGSKSLVVMREHWENKYLNSCCLEKVPQGPSSLPLPKLGGLGGPLPYKKYKSFREKNTNHLEKKNKAIWSNWNKSLQSRWSDRSSIAQEIQNHLEIVASSNYSLLTSLNKVIRTGGGYLCFIWWRGRWEELFRWKAKVCKYLSTFFVSICQV